MHHHVAVAGSPLLTNSIAVTFDEPYQSGAHNLSSSPTCQTQTRQLNNPLRHSMCICLSLDSRNLHKIVLSARQLADYLRNVQMLPVSRRCLPSARQIGA